ncbi:MAG: nucleotidyltransferase domain-containing protein [Candidatus Helarchaeota archaeon]
MRRLHKSNNIEKSKIVKKLTDSLMYKKDIIFAYLHGSFILDVPFHDIDIAIFVENSEINEKEFVDYEIQLSIELELKLKLLVDIKLLNFAPLSFRYQITKGNLLFCKNKEFLYNFIENTWNNYLSFKPYRDLALKYLLNIVT